jgi:uncharacterized membrane protein
VTAFSLLDYAALAVFVTSWAIYHVGVESTQAGGRSLNRVMNDYRRVWMERMLARENRMVDTSIMAALQNGTAFFASTSLIAVGGTLTLLRSAEAVLATLSGTPLGNAARLAWELKVIGLAVIFVYAFFKFAWSYRLFNYAAILMGGVPLHAERDTAEAQAAVARVARVHVVAGKHFNRGQRAFFFALAYLGWFVSPWAFMAATGAVLYVIWRRQFASDAIAALDG